MIIIREVIRGTEFSYNKCYCDSRNIEQVSKVVSFTRATVEYEGYTYLYLYDIKMNLISEVFLYVNEKIKKQSVNTRDGVITALKLLYCFAELFEIQIKSISKNDAIKFKSFLSGLDAQGHEFEMRTITERSTDTVNQYFSVYRGFLEYLGVTNSPFHQKEIVRMTKGDMGMMAHAQEKVVEKYSLQDSSRRETRKVPMYIKADEFKRILKTIRTDYSLREEIIVTLMYTCGIRIGEVFGLTLEDLGTSLSDTIHRSLTDLGLIIIRNRVTDKRDQLAKTCMIPINIDDYKTDKYKSEGRGYQTVKPTVNLLRKIDQYIEEMHGDMSKLKRKNYLSKAKADKVSNTVDLMTDENFYIFLNKNGTPLRKEGWNKILREIYVKSGISVDYDKREHNLSHRFRHGYAMFLKKYKNYTELDLMDALRHKSLSAVACYFRPDDDDLYEANKRATETMYELIPELKE